ncbi:MAG: ABC transporter permease [Acetobacteraceae bacterium]|nr:ABC transporter permease [Acetobacteraceae bacterium]
MTRFILQRFFSMVIALWVIVTVTFLLMHAIPGGPFTFEKKLPEAILRNIEARYHLDWPLWKQYADYMWNLLKWDLGPSFKYEARTVNDIINSGFPISATLGALSVSLALVIGLPAGIISALNQNKWQDNAAMFAAIVGVSVPNFILASLLMYVFALKLGWLPPARWGSPQQVIMPVIALSGFSTAFIARLMRSSMLEVVQQDYIRTARAKGLPQLMVIYRHAVKNAIIPVVTYLGPLIAGVFTGSFIIEHIFAIPGLGKHYVTSIYNRDYTVILGVTIFYSILLVLMNFLVDVAYVFIDPRISYVEQRE